MRFPPMLICLLLSPLALAEEPADSAPAEAPAAEAPPVEAPQVEASKADGQPGWLAELPLIEREVLFGNPDQVMPRLSPDGSKLAWIAPVDGVLNVHVAPVGDLAAAKAVTGDTDRGIRNFSWTFAGNFILYQQDTAGDENFHVYSVNIDTGETKDLTPFEGVRAEVQQLSEKFPTEALLSINKRKKKLHDLYRVDITTGELAMVTKNKGYMGFLTDDDFNVRLAMKMKLDGGTYVLQANGKKWEEAWVVPFEDALTTAPIGFDKSGQTLYAIDSRDRNTAALVTVDLATGEPTVLYANEKADVDDVAVNPVDGKVVAVASTYERREWALLDEAFKTDMLFLAGVAEGDMEVVSSTADNGTWIVAYERADGPVLYYLYDREARTARFLFTNRPALDDLLLADMHSRVIEARDGLDLVSYLTLPVGSDPDGDGVPDQPLPMVLLVHGGPWYRDFWGFNGMHQWLANRGYAVLSVNFRGSTGLGKEFINAANLQWGAKMHDDLLDAVTWATEQGIAHKDRVAIVGGSYGGYATLVGLSMTPDVFACGVDIVGPSNLNTLLESFPAYWKPLREMFTTRVGDPKTQEGKALLEERSPLNHASAIKKPLLIGQGANDPRVKQAESDRIVAAMGENHIPVTYILYPDEGHGFAKPENRLSFFAATDVFLAQHLGGRAEPIGDDLEGSSIAVPNGAELIEGLPTAAE